MRTRISLGGTIAAISMCAIFAAGGWAQRAEAAKSARPRQISIGSGETVSASFVVKAADPRLEAVGRRALAEIGVDPAVLFPGWQVNFRRSNKRLLGLTLVRERRIDIFVRRNRSVNEIAHDIAHEFGHVVDVEHFSTGLRMQYLEIRGLSQETPWWVCDSCRDLDVGAGDFAEVFAQLVRPGGPYYSDLAPKPSSAQMEQIRRLMPSAVADGLRAPTAAE